MKTLQPNIAPAEAKMNWFQHFMMLCSGANIHVLRKHHPSGISIPELVVWYYLLLYLQRYLPAMPCILF